MVFTNQSFINKGSCCLPSTREVLINHLKVQIKSLYPSLANQLIPTVVAQSTNEDILSLLSHPQQLQEKLNNILSSTLSKATRCESTEKEDIGEILFPLVAAIDTELCAQITGMLLEMEVQALHYLLKNPSDLEKAVKKAKEEYIRYTCNTELRKEELGEKLFAIVSKNFPKEAAKITGMLLEMDIATLEELINSKSELQIKVIQARDALNHESNQHFKA